MDLFDLSAKISLDSNDFKSGVEKAKNSGEKLAHSIGSGIGNAAKAAGHALASTAKAVTAAAGVAAGGIATLTAKAVKE